MNAYRRLETACRAIDLDLRCESTPAEPRFSAALDLSGTNPILDLRYRNDGTITPAMLHHDPAVPGVLFEIVEETVRREPVLELWLPSTVRHRFVAWRDGGNWTLAPLPGDTGPVTVAEAVALVGACTGDGVQR